MVTRAARRGTTRTRMTARRAADSPYLGWLARAGLAARGTMYILIGIIAVEIATGNSQPAGRSYRRGAAGREDAIRLGHLCGCW